MGCRDIDVHSDKRPAVIRIKMSNDFKRSQHKNFSPVAADGHQTIICFLNDRVLSADIAFDKVDAAMEWVENNFHVDGLSTREAQIEMRNIIHMSMVNVDEEYIYRNCLLGIYWLAINHYDSKDLINNNLDIMRETLGYAILSVSIQKKSRHFDEWAFQVSENPTYLYPRKRISTRI